MTPAVTPTTSRWILLGGVISYVGLLAAGYYYNLTFVQLGLIDLGTRSVGMTGRAVSGVMAFFAVTALVVAVAAGWWLDRRGWSSNLRTKLRILFFVITAQTALTMVVGAVATPGQYRAWVLAGAVAIGVGMPVTFGLMIDFVPVRHRGAVAAAVAGLAFFVAALYPVDWRIEAFAPVMTALLIPAVVVLGVLAYRPFRFVDQWASQHREFGIGRFCRPEAVRTFSVAFWGPLVLMFSVFFIDSLGFLRIIESPSYISTSWQSPEVGIRVFIALTHIVGAAMAGVLYTALHRRWLWGAVLALFAFTHLLYTFHLGTAPLGVDPPLTLPLFYVLAVSFYTTLNFALWPDLSTPANIGLHAGLGVGIAGWLASFLSTSLALYSESAGLSLLDHLRHVNALALLLAVAFPLVLYLRRMRTLAGASEAR
ncbi:MAG TPA: MFS transporter [Acidimicrobiia bacterium]|nr:MFS transporter [Acidimicrobiia bacterium]